MHHMMKYPELPEIRQVVLGSSTEESSKKLDLITSINKADNFHISFVILDWIKRALVYFPAPQVQWNGAGMHGHGPVGQTRLSVSRSESYF